MREELDQALCAKYPEIFRDRHKPMTETAMCWGLACGDGWYTLIDTLCGLIMAEVTRLRQELAYCEKMLDRADELEGWAKDHYTTERRDTVRVLLEYALQDIPVAAQVKEKYGGLCFYVDGGTAEHRALIRFAEEMSFRTCETCGTTREVYQTTGWVHTVCEPCAASQNLLDRLDKPAAP